MPSLLSFLTGLLTGILVSAAGTYFHRLADKKKKHDELLYQVYMHLIELSGRHFWLIAQEARREEPNPEQGRRFNDARRRTADLLRQIDRLPEMNEILTAMFSVRFANESERAREIDRLVRVIGDRVNPRYNKAIRAIDAENQKLFQQNMDEYYRKQKRLEG